MNRLTELRNHVREHAENRPGVYRMLGPSGEVLYVGKSTKVRTRLLSYFRARRGEKAAEILGHAHRIEWEYSPSEFAALLQELRLIRRFRPLYNVEHKFDASYCFIKLTREAAPRLLVVGQPASDGGLYYGPFRGRMRAQEAVREISDVLGLRDCGGGVRLRFADQIDLFGREERPLCMRGDLHRCLAPCAARCTQAEYLERVDAARGFLDGSTARPLTILRERMRLAAERLHFEYAAEVRDRIARLETLQDELVASRGSVDALSFVYFVPGYGGDDRYYLLRRGQVRAEFPAPRTAAEHEALKRRIQEVFSRPEPAGAPLQSRQIAEVLLVARWFRLRPEEKRNVFPVESLPELGLSA